MKKLRKPGRDSFWVGVLDKLGLDYWASLSMRFFYLWMDWPIVKAYLLCKRIFIVDELEQLQSGCKGWVSQVEFTGYWDRIEHFVLRLNGSVKAVG